MVKSQGDSDSSARLPLDETPPPEIPNFEALLQNPIVTTPLPKDFTPATECEHLRNLWSQSSELRELSFEAFVHAGGSGMVFRVRSPLSPMPLAVKIARRKLFDRPPHPNTPTALSPVSAQELRALERISHPNVVRLYTAIADANNSVFAILTSYVPNPRPLDQYLTSTLEKHPDKKGRKGIQPFSPQRLDNACSFLVQRFEQIASALHQMHGQGLYHCDVKPANILVDAQQHQAVLTDLGSCTSPDDVDSNGRVKIQFTWTYAHPQLTTIASDPHSISGGGLKAWAPIEPKNGLARFDLFAFGRTIQETLALLEREFGERCYASYGFRFLHLLACLLLDGHNAPIKGRIREHDERRFVSDTALDYPVEVFSKHLITCAAELVDRLHRFRRDYSWDDDVPELDSWQPRVINTGSGGYAPFTSRVKAIFEHPALLRLKSECQLGWVKEVYPGATHTRWSHSLGVCSAVAEYYRALLSDPEIPTARVLLQSGDINHAFLAAMIHDAGQVAFGHDLEGAVPDLYDHEDIVRRLLDESSWGVASLRKLIASKWPDVDVNRVLAILGNADAESEPTLLPVDGIAKDVISGPIDADKLDYVTRDAVYCSVAYGRGVDRPRFLRAVTVDAKAMGRSSRLALAYRAKGSASIESLLLARYQMYGAVYWHHTFRCIQAMFSHAAAATFGPNPSTQRIRNTEAVTATSRVSPQPRGKNVEASSTPSTVPTLWLREVEVSKSLLKDVFYYRVVCGHTIARCQEILRKYTLPKSFTGDDAPPAVSSERALEFVWKFADDSHRHLIERLAKRELYTRVFELKVGDLGESEEYSALAADLSASARISLAETLCQRLLNAIHKKMIERGPVESATETEARQRHVRLQESKWPLVVIDFPTRGIPDEKNFPREIGDASRKYISGRARTSAPGRNVFYTVRRLQTALAALRVFAAPELHELIVRYLDPDDVQESVESVIPRIKSQQ